MAKAKVPHGTTEVTPVYEAVGFVPAKAAATTATVKHVQMHAGVDLLGSKTSVHSGNSHIYEADKGLVVVGKKTGRKVVIPYNNIRGYELL